MGASTSNITTLLSKTLLMVVMVAVIIASPAAWWAMHKWLEGFAYRIGMRWWMFAAAGVGAMLIALITVSVKAARVAMANPAKSIRTA